MTMKKRILAALMALAMLGAFSGCSNTGNGGSASGGSDSDTIRIGGPRSPHRRCSQLRRSGEQRHPDGCGRHQRQRRH